ncbi:unnamed protein product [Moneuplotes crassus]|uniref:Uncharacterized protein n=1 Tax=Euplotes crassus TaxID=5936 RepID=A0AAD1XE94_EUPCR|nr:unnamed protein product [Moneuplotes crassus]
MPYFRGDLRGIPAIAYMLITSQVLFIILRTSNLTIAVSNRVRDHNKSAQKSGSNLLTLCLGDTPCNISRTNLSSQKKSKEVYASPRFPILSTKTAKRTPSEKTRKTEKSSRNMPSIKRIKIGLPTYKDFYQKQHNSKPLRKPKDLRNIKQRSKSRNPSQSSEKLMSYFNSKRLDRAASKFHKKQKSNIKLVQNEGPIVEGGLCPYNYKSSVKLCKSTTGIVL